MDSDPYLQVDLNQWVLVTEVGVQGDPVEEKWVSGYTLSYKQNVSPWTFKPYTTKHSIMVWKSYFFGLIMYSFFPSFPFYSPIIFTLPFTFLLSHYFTLNTKKRLKTDQKTTKKPLKNY